MAAFSVSASLGSSLTIELIGPGAAQGAAAMLQAISIYAGFFSRSAWRMA